MYRAKLIVGFLLVITSLNGWSQEEVREVASFNELKVGNAIEVILQKGDKEKVRIKSDGIPLKKIETDVQGNRLGISIAEGSYHNASVKVYVTYVHLVNLSASSASSIFTEGVLKGEELDLRVSSAADVFLELEVDKLEVYVSSAGDVELKGKAKSAELAASSAGSVSAYDFKVSKAKVRASSGGSIKVYCTDEIVAKASSGGSIRYMGNPSQSQTDSSSGGSVKSTN